MPTQDELAGLYDNREVYRATQHVNTLVHLTKLIELSTCCLWASESRGHEATGFYFTGAGARGLFVQFCPNPQVPILPVHNDK